MFADLETPHLRLKCIGMEDADFFYKQFSTAEVNRYLYDAEPCSSVDEAKEWIEFYLQPEPRGHHRWILVRKDNGEKIGTCGFHCLDREAGSVETGYDLQPAYWRQDYMTEAMTAALAFARDVMEVQTVLAHISVDNLASARTAEKLGFVRTGEQYDECFRGEKYPHDIYRMILH